MLRVKAMSRTAKRLAILVLCAVGLAPVSAAQAQWSGASRRPPPLYPYELQPGQSYAVEVAPGTYVIHRGSNRRAYPYARPRPRSARRRYRAAPAPRRTHADRGLIEELRRRHARVAAKKAAEKAAKRAALARKAARRAARKARKRVEKDKYAGRRPDKVINTRQIVREKPLVIETRRVIDHPAKVITRRHYVDDVPTPPRRGTTGSIARKPAGDEDPRVIHAEAEITILGPDRMSIRLLRKDGQGLDANARVRKAK